MVADAGGNIIALPERCSGGLNSTVLNAWCIIMFFTEKYEILFLNYGKCSKNLKSKIIISKRKIPKIQ